MDFDLKLIDLFRKMEEGKRKGHDAVVHEYHRVKELLQQRDDRARRVVQLRAMGYSYNEIAAELHISESSARVIEHRTRTWLKQMLAKEGYDL